MADIPEPNTDSGYIHDFNYRLNNLHQAMDYNDDGEPIIRTIDLSGTSSNTANQIDATGRQRVSQPFTMFDSQLRYSKRDDLFTERVTGVGNVDYVLSESTCDLTVGTAAGDEVVRETRRVFAYQPGKSLQVLMTFRMDPGEAGLEQLIGYFGDDNGVYFMNKDGENHIVLRSLVDGETIIPQSSWNIDPMDGNGPSEISLDITKAQLWFMDLEWLGVGQVRVGFVIGGRYYFCHIFKHSNVIDTTFMQTACLPVRYCIRNNATTQSPSTLKQICATVFSEGGYDLTGRKHAAARPINLPIVFPTLYTFYPVISIRLKADRPDAIAVIKAVNILGVANNSRMSWGIVLGATTTGGVWQSDPDSHVEYNVSPLTYTGGRLLQDGFMGVNNQSQQEVQLSPELFAYQLERDGLNGGSYEITVIGAGWSNNDSMLAGIAWEEIF